MTAVAEPYSLYDAACDLYIVPVRHHSPACAAHLLALLAEIRPARVLVEGPCDFDPLIALVADAGTRPPVAIVSVEDGKGDGGKVVGGRRAVSYYPFSAHSPEYAALVAAKVAGIPAAFIDLPMSDRAIGGDGEALALLHDEAPFNSSDYVRALARRLGCRDGNEVWDHLFEAQLHRCDWRRFFHEVGSYCRHMRDCTDAVTMEADGTLAREAQMRALIARARSDTKGPMVAVVGGFHAPVLAGSLKAGDKVKAAGKGSRAYLVRYGHRQLNALTGYSAGLALPAFYDGLWRRRGDGEGLYSAYATDLITGFAAHLRERLPGFAPSFPVMASALEAAHRLADLRGRPGPLRDDILDACRSTLLKGEETGDAAPVMAELMAWLTGNALGEIPPSAGSPPLVEAVRARARSLGFMLDDGERRNRDLDIYRKDRHRDASRFLHGLVFVSAGFGQRTAGPDFRQGVELDRLHEIWSVMWSPMVEARLIELSADGDTLESAVAAEAARRLRDLREHGRGHSAIAAIELFVAASQAGIGDRAAVILPFIADEVTHDPELAGVAQALRDLVRLWRSAVMIGLDNCEPLAELIGAAWRRVLFLLPNLATCSEDHVSTAVNGLVILREVVELAANELDTLDTGLFDEGIAALLTADLHPALAGAVAAVACLAGRLEPSALAARITGELGGAYAEAKGRVAYLGGLIAVSRELLWTVPELVTAMDEVLAEADGDGFIALLPHLRLTFSRLDPQDIDRLARIVADRRQGAAAQLTRPFAVTESAFAANLELDRAVAAELALAGIGEGAAA